MMQSWKQWPVVTDELVEFRKKLDEAQDFSLENIPQIKKEKLKDFFFFFSF